MKVITKLPNSEQSYKRKVKTHNYINRQNQSTHFTEQSSSLIDLILTNNVNRLIYTGVGLAFTDQIRYHCSVIGFI
jgi:hypothetical protein